MLHLVDYTRTSQCTCSWGASPQHCTGAPASMEHGLAPGPEPQHACGAPDARRAAAQPPSVGAAAAGPPAARCAAARAFAIPDRVGFLPALTAARAGAQLEYISMVGFVFVLIMVATVIIQACLNGLPGWYSGDFAPIGFSNIGAAAAAPAPAPVSDRASRALSMAHRPAALQATLHGTRRAFMPCAMARSGAPAEAAPRAAPGRQRGRDGEHHRLRLLPAAHRHADAARDAARRGRLQDPEPLHAHHHHGCAARAGPASSLRARARGPRTSALCAPSGSTRRRGLCITHCGGCSARAHSGFANPTTRARGPRQAWPSPSTSCSASSARRAGARTRRATCWRTCGGRGRTRARSTRCWASTWPSPCRPSATPPRTS